MHEWFVVAQFSAWAVTPNGPEMTPTSVTHAKRMGDLVTACGLNCASWKRWYASPFPMRGVSVCPACLDVTNTAASPTSKMQGSTFRTALEADVRLAIAGHET
jgi:hypothetical protein